MKPKGLCAVATQLHRANSIEFATQQCAVIEQAFEAEGATIRLGVESEFEEINNFRKRIFGPLAAALGDFELIRILRHGYAITLRQNDEIVGLELGCSYDDGEERTDYGLMICADSSIGGKGWMAKLNRYACLIAMKRGGTVRKCITSPENYASLSNLVNRCGYSTEAFLPNVFGKASRIQLRIELTPESLANNSIDFDKVADFIAKHEAGKDYLLLDPTDNKALEQAHNENWSIVAYLKPSDLNAFNTLLAVPIQATKGVVA